MKLARDTVSISFPAPSYCVYALSFQHTIHQVIYRFDSELGLRFQMVNSDNVEIPYQVYRADGDICNEKLFLLENKQGKTNIIQAYKSCKYILIVTHHGHLDRAVYADKIKFMTDNPTVLSLPEQELSVMRTPALNLLLSNLD